MAAHSHLLRNDWLSGTQKRVARITFDRVDGLQIDVPELRSVLPDIDVDGLDEVAVLEQVHRAMTGTYYEATVPYAGDYCPDCAANGDAIDMEMRRTAPAVPAA